MARTKQTARRPSTPPPGISLSLHEEPYGFEPTVTCQYTGCHNLVLTGFMVCGQCNESPVVTSPLIVPSFLQRVLSSWPPSTCSSVVTVAANVALSHSIPLLVSTGWVKCNASSCDVYTEGGGLCNLCEENRVKELGKREQKQANKRMVSDYNRMVGRHSRVKAIRYNNYTPMPTYAQRKKMTRAELIRTKIRCKPTLRLDKKHDSIRM
jgi:hypothetical protein